MAISVGELITLPELQLTLLAGSEGAEREVGWAHTCDLPDPWRWVGAGQALLTNGSTIPSNAGDQVAWAKALVENNIAAVGVGAEMGGAELTQEMLQVCDALK